jgi:hypothetical protein
MKWVDINNNEVLSILTEYSDWFFQSDLNRLTEISHHEGRHQGMKLEEACGEEYLKEIVDKDGQHIGYPERTISVDIASEERVSSEHKKKRSDLADALCAYLGARNQAVNVFYPEGGYMGWHNNWNASGYNILLSYSPTGNGFFRYMDPLTKEIVTMEDKPGWTCKVGYYGRGREPDKVYYHCAGSYEPRVTLGFVVPHLEIWQSMIEDISGEDATSFQ